MEQWVAYVDGASYGFFPTQHRAWEWIAKEFPIATSQGNYKISIFISI